MVANPRSVSEILEGVMHCMRESDPEQRRQLQLQELRTELLYAEIKLGAEPNEPFRIREVKRLRDEISTLMRSGRRAA